jgi:GTPase SAR1 family protein
LGPNDFILDWDLTKIEKINETDFQIQMAVTPKNEKLNEPLINAIIKDSNIFLVVFSITDEKSFNNVDTWIKKIKQLKQEVEDTKYSFIIIGNKVDLQNERKISTEKIKKLSTFWNCSFLESSAIQRINLHESFELAIKNHFHDPNKKEKKECILM